MPTKNKVELFLDSGAFSAWSQNKEISLSDYISFIKENKSVISIYANLDVIGNAEQTYKNQRVMEKAGLTPLPIFHYGEDEKWLKKYLSANYSYLALGGMVPISTNDLIHWLDRLFVDFLTDEKGIPTHKVHGFGLTSLRLLLRYPWYSVDSTSWVVTGRMGSIYVPRKKNGKWIYDEDSWKVAVSSRSPNIKEAGQHINSFPPQVHKEILSYIGMKGYKLGKSKFVKVGQERELDKNERWAEKKPKGKSAKRLLEIIEEDGVSNRYQLRDEMNIIYFLDLEKSISQWPWAFKQRQQSKMF